MDQLPPTNEQILMQVTQGFLQRSDLKGGEVDNYAKAFNLIQTIVEGTNVVVPAKAWQNGLAALQAVQELADSAGKDVPTEPTEDIPVEEKEEDTSNGEEMISEGGPAPELNPVELEESE